MSSYREMMDYVRLNMQTRPVRISDNALLIDDCELSLTVWFELRQFETEIAYQRIWLLHEHAHRARGVTDPDLIRGSRPVRSSYRVRNLPRDVRANLEGFHNFLRVQPEYASVSVYIPDITVDNSIPAWNGDKYDWHWVNNISRDDPKRRFMH
jgi:hypothetical protein